YGAQAFAMQLDGGTHADQSVGKTKAVLIHGFVDDGDTVGLAQCHGQGLLPVGHESGVHIGCQDRKSTRRNSSHVSISYAVISSTRTARADVRALSLHDALPILRSPSIRDAAGWRHPCGPKRR